MADWHLNYNATGAPLTVGNLVISGVAGGDEGARGFVAAFDQATGKEAWRFWTVPLRGEPGSETWQGPGIEHPSAATWLTGTYDPQLDTLYWPTGNPGPDLNGDKRLGDNLFSSSIVALDGIFSTRRTTSGTGTRSSRLCLSIRRGTAAPANCCSTPIAMDSSTCSTGPMANCCSRSLS
jgi:outer membrane protein assembly factor BamB